MFMMDGLKISEQDMGGTKDGEQGAESFADYLETLKQSGGGLLITGTASATARTHVSRTLFGDVSSGPEGQSAQPTRKRLLVKTDDKRPAAAYLPKGVQPQDDAVEVVTARWRTRSAAAPAPTAPSDPLTDLEHEIDMAVARLIRSDAPAPGVLRIGVTSLEPFIQNAGMSAAMEFLSQIVARAEVWCGVAHIHFPVPDTEAWETVYTNLVDARVEVRDTVWGPEWLWHTMNADIDTRLDWLLV